MSFQEEIVKLLQEKKNGAIRVSNSTVLKYLENCEIKSANNNQYYSKLKMLLNSSPVRFSRYHSEKNASMTWTLNLLNLFHTNWDVYGKRKPEAKIRIPLKLTKCFLKTVRGVIKNHPSVSHPFNDSNKWLTCFQI